MKHLKIHKKTAKCTVQVSFLPHFSDVTTGREELTVLIAAMEHFSEMKKLIDSEWTSTNQENLVEILESKLKSNY